MTELLDKAIAAARTLAADEQDEVARLILSMSNAQAPEPLRADHTAAVAEGLEQAKRGQFASDDAVAKALRRFG